MESVALALVCGLFLGAIAATWWIAAQNASKRKRSRRPALPRRRPRYARDELIYENDTGYDSPLGLVDDPDDEWVEWAIMDDMLDDGGTGEGLW